MDAEKKMEQLITDYLDQKVTKEETPMIWAYCQVLSEKFRLQHEIKRRMLKMSDPDIETVVSQLNSELTNFSEE